jgi:hypothetical protein
MAAVLIGPTTKTTTTTNTFIHPIHLCVAVFNGAQEEV